MAHTDPDLARLALVILPDVGTGPLAAPDWLGADHPYGEVLLVQRAAATDPGPAPLPSRCRAVHVDQGASFATIAGTMVAPHGLLVDQHTRPHLPGIRALLAAHIRDGADLSAGLVAGLTDPAELSGRLKRPELLRFENPVPPGGLIVSTAHLRRFAEAADIAYSDGAMGLWPVFRLLAHHGLLAPQKIVAARHPDADMAEPPRRPPLAHRDRVAAAGWGFGAAAEPGRRILVCGRIDASVAHYFDGLPPALGRHFRYLEPTTPVHDLLELAAADAVILVRTFQRPMEDGTLDLLGRLGVPVWYFADDHYPSLRAGAPDLWYYSPANLAAFFGRVSGVLAATAALAAEFARNHAVVRHWPVVVDPSLIPGVPSPVSVLRAAIIGGDFRRANLVGNVLPALRDRTPRPTLIHRADLGVDVSGLDAVAMPFDVSFRQFVYRWRRQSPSVVAHPRGVTQNLAYKSPASILAALYLGVVPVLAREPAYDAIDPAESGVVFAEDGAAGWRAALTEAHDPARRADRFARLSRWGSARFAADAVETLVDEILAGAADPSEAAREDRLRRAVALRPALRDLARRRGRLEREFRRLGRRLRFFLR